MNTAAVALLAKRTTAQLVEDFAVADKLEDAFVAETTRGWLMDALEARDAAAFDRWLDTPNMTVSDLRSAYEVAA